ncbi:cation transporter [Arthrobacter sp. MSA 4-2]|uniref:cation transporter n=1 Tax=Arthrobacter sp. MSA 4-2 TaxID=2794349 RepID=UPI0018E81BA5|nr:cation transporter [Arthrobacter sp. MSA 4-2]MBJ2121436.1 cation transporter [Arthrobacter sp. MSA 4-2]
MSTHTSPASVQIARPAPSVQRRAVLSRRIRLLVGATITYNVIEAGVAISAGTVASSSALIGFGLDSIVEVLSAAAVAWQFAGRDPEAREKTALRLIAFSFFGLAAFVTFDAVRTLLGASEPQHSLVGIVLAAVSLAVMPFLSWAQRRAGRELGSRSAVADSKQTLLCTYLSGVLLVGLLLNSTLGWSWADPVAALIIAAVAIKEGHEAWKGDSCCAPSFGNLDDDQSVDTCGSAPGGGSESCCSTGTTTGAPVAVTNTSVEPAALTLTVRPAGTNTPESSPADPESKTADASCACCTHH